VTAAAPPPRPVGPEIAVNVATLGSHVGPVTALFADGGFVVVWTDYGAQKTAVHARLFRRDGTPASGEFRLVAPSASNPIVTSVVVDRDDSFLLAWDDNFADQPSRMMVQRFRRSGQPLGPALQVHAPSLFSRGQGRLALRPGGGFAVAWMAVEDHITHTDDIGDIYAFDVYARSYTAAGAPLGPEFLVNEGTFDDQTLSDLAVGPDGTLTVLFTTWDQATFLAMRRLSPRGRPLVHEIDLDVIAHGAASPLSMAPDGTFTVAWSSFNYIAGGDNVFAQRFDADGSPLAPALQVNLFSQGGQSIGDLASLPDGGFVAVWTDSRARDGSGEGIFYRAFGPDGTPLLARDLRVNATAAGDQFWPVLAGRDGRFVAAWNQSNGTPHTGKIRARILAGN
jgi:hypothetical protein